MITVQDLEPLLFAGGDVVGDDGKKIGSVGQLFLDARTGNPAWVTVTTGLFGKAESFVPMVGAEVHGSELHVPYRKDAVKHAPRIESAEGHLSPDEERDLYRHYGLLHDDDADADGRDELGTDTTEAGYGTTGPGTGVAAPVPVNAFAPVAPTSPGPPPRALDDDVRGDDIRDDDDLRREATGTPAASYDGDAAHDADVSGAHSATPASADSAATADTSPTDSASTAEPMVLSAEQARVVGTERVPTERVRMRRYTVTEPKQITVPVEREEFRVEYEPVADDAEPEAPAKRSPRHAADPSSPDVGPDDRRP
jgi:hypothetical protein